VDRYEEVGIALLRKSGRRLKHGILYYLVIVSATYYESDLTAQFLTAQLFIEF